MNFMLCHSVLTGCCWVMRMDLMVFLDITDDLLIFETFILYDVIASFHDMRVVSDFENIFLCV